MLPLVALLLCTAFVFFLLRLERRAAHDISFAVWIPTAWMLIAASRPLIQWFVLVGPGGPAPDNDAGSALDRWVLTGLAIAAIVVLIPRRMNWWEGIRRHKWLIALLTYMLVSTFWSDITLIALKRYSREFIALIMAFVIQSEASPRTALESIFRRTAYVLLPFSIVLIKYYPYFGVQYGRWSGALMWVGVTNQKNQLGRLCLLSSFFLMFAIYRSWRDKSSKGANRPQVWADAFVLLLGLYLLKGSDSVTSMVTLVVAALLLAVLRLFRTARPRIPKFAIVGAVLAVMAIGTWTPFIGGADLAKYTSFLGRDSTFTGRTEVWAAVLPARVERPLLGYGLGSFWTDARRLSYDIPTSHNGYLDILLEMGEVGLLIYIGWLLSCALMLSRLFRQDQDWASVGICFLFIGLVYNITESALNSITDHMTAVTVFTTFILAYPMDPVVERVKTLVPFKGNPFIKTPSPQAFPAALKSPVWSKHHSKQAITNSKPDVSPVAKIAEDRSRFSPPPELVPSTFTKSSKLSRWNSKSSKTNGIGVDSRDSNH